MQKGAAKASIGLPFVGGFIAGATVLSVQTGDAKAAVGAAVDAENPINNLDAMVNCLMNHKIKLY